MVTINNEVLKEVYHQLTTIDNIVQKEIRLVNGNKWHLDKMVPEELSKVYSIKQKTAQTFTDSLTRTAYDNSVIALVATFERVVFAKYKTSYGSIRNTVITHSVKPLDYYNSRAKFINDGVEYLAEILHLLEGIIDDTLFDKLRILKDHRNYISHGKRGAKPPAVEFTLDQIATTLDGVIREIEK